MLLVNSKHMSRIAIYPEPQIRIGFSYGTRSGYYKSIEQTLAP